MKKSQRQVQVHNKVYFDLKWDGVAPEYKKTEYTCINTYKYINKYEYINKSKLWTNWTKLQLSTMGEYCICSQMENK